MPPDEIAQEVLRENGHWLVSHLGAEGLDDLIWDVYPAYQAMGPEERERVRAEVEKEIFG